MMTAVPYSAGQVSPHFSRAESIVLISDAGQVVDQFLNPATAGECIGQQALTSALQQRQVTRVLVRNIGQSMLAKLLQLSFEVYQVPRGFEPERVRDLTGCIRLEHARQGKASPRCTKNIL